MRNQRPTNALSYDYHDPVFWDEGALKTEVDRIFDICHGCRLCFNLCPSFDSLFKLIDQHENGSMGLSADQRDRVMDECYQCKLCYNKCPYTPAENHAFQLDFPRLMLRYKAIKAKKKGVPLRDKLLARPELIGRLGGLFPALANWANTNGIHRRLLQWVGGIHAKKALPRFHKNTFSRWFLKKPVASGKRQVALFHTCFVEHNAPDIGKDAVFVLESNGCEVVSPVGQTCCGMPALDSGDVDFAKRRAQHTVRVFADIIKKQIPVVAINPTCSLMLKEEYPRLLAGTSLATQAKELSELTQDLGEYLKGLKTQDAFNTHLGPLSSDPEVRVTYQAPCHLRAQNIGFPMRDLMKLIPDISLGPVMECSGHDGTWAMKHEFFELSSVAGKKCFDAVSAQQSACVTSDCPLAGLQIEQHTGYSCSHPVQLLAQSYKSYKE